LKLLPLLILSFVLCTGFPNQIDKFEYGHWTFPLDQANQQVWLNQLGEQGWIECFPHNAEIHCSRPLPWSTQFEWKSWEIEKRVNIDTLLNEAGQDNYDQCFVWDNKRLWCSRPLLSS